jgi:hypothetical protein
MARVTRKTELDLGTESVQKIVTAAVVATQGAVDSHRRELTVEMTGDALPVMADAARSSRRCATCSTTR